MNPWRLCVAPMMEWTDRHCRYFHRVLSRHARLYTEMIATGALLYGDRKRHLDFDPSESPLALQLGGSDPAELAACASMGERWGYREINLNCGCPSDRVRDGAFGACLMAYPDQVADCVRAMRDAVSIDVTVKHRLGIDRRDDYGFVRDFVGSLRAAGCSTFIVHARNAWLSGLSPKENREVPPLRYAAVHRLKADFPDCAFVLNGGLDDAAAVLREMPQVDGVMLGRAAYRSPWLLVELERTLFGPGGAPATVTQVVDVMSGYLDRAVAAGVPVRAVVRPLLGLLHGQPGARAWRRLLSEPVFLDRHGSGALRAAARMALVTDDVLDAAA
ncbi:MAG: tRNA dihydrouridine(20/20a) synthase DusA [Burkholderiaceae bacterium]|nr:tRNA dihydrouridine(20/20a) synthase DusA [Burkholderiaceae bacterium]